MCCAVFKALFVRSMLMTQSALAAWRVTNVLHTDYFWLLLLPHVGLFPETIYRIKVKEGREWKW